MVRDIAATLRGKGGVNIFVYRNWEGYDEWARYKREGEMLDDASDGWVPRGIYWDCFVFVPIFFSKRQGYMKGGGSNDRNV